MPFKLIHDLVCETVPNALRNVPVPAKFSDLKSLSFGDLVKLTLFWGVSGGIVYCVVYTAQNRFSHKKPKCGLVNLSIEKDSGKVVHSVDIESSTQKQVLCRCWRSKKFPYCDGSHASHNNETGDNVGPVIVNRK